MDPPSGRYVAPGSSMAAGPGILPHAPAAPWPAFRYARNYTHLVASALGLDLVDVTYTGATTANVLAEPQHGAPPQVSALDGSEALVTVTIGGNDVGYVPLLTAAYLPRPMRSLPIFGRRMRELLDDDARERALTAVADALLQVGRMLRLRAPRARIRFVDYLTVLPPPGVDTPPLSKADADLGRHVAETLESHTAEAAAATGCEIVRAGDASRAHHAWSLDPWTTKGAVPLPRRPFPFHPTAVGMRAVAELVAAQVSKPTPACGQSSS